MDNLVSLFTTTSGRIGRGQWWMGTIILIVINLAITFLILPMIGFGMPSGAALMADPNILIPAMAKSGWASLVLFLIFAFPLYALGVKRRHDRDKSGIDVAIYLVLIVVVVLLQALGLAYVTGTVAGQVIPAPTTLFMIISFVFLVFAIYMLVVLGFLKGTAGANQYGPDPLGGA